MNLKMIYQTYKAEIDKSPHKPSREKKSESSATNQGIKSVIADAQVTTMQSHYSTDYELKSTAVNIVNEDEDMQEHEGAQPVEMKSIEPNMNEIELDKNRIVHPDAGLSELYEFVPATQLKGKLHVFLFPEDSCKSLTVIL